MTEEVSRFQGNCPVHGDPALDTCERCGSFVCARCEAIDAVPGEPARCEACREKVGAGWLPWEGPTGSLFDRWWKTTRALWFHPTRTLERVRPGRFGWSLAYALLNAIVVAAFAILGTAIWMATVSVGGDFVSRFLPIAGGIAYMAFAFETMHTLFGGLAFHVGLRLAGARRPVRDSIWNLAFTSALHLLYVPAMIVMLVPVTGPLVLIISTLAIEVLTAIHLSTAARAHAGLRGGRATFAGWVPFMLLFLPPLFCCIGGVVLRM